MFSTIRKHGAVAGSVAVLALGLAACGSDTDPAATDTDTATEEMTSDDMMSESESMSDDMMSESDMMSDDMSASESASGDESALTLTPVGEACSAVPADGEGSSAGMADDPVATAASNNPLLGTLVTAVGAADLGSTLNGLEGATVFAPIDDAFSGFSEEELQGLLEDTGTLTDVLTFHVVPENLTLADLMEMDELTTVQGETLTLDFESGVEEGLPTVSGSNTVNVICGDVQTANATVHLVDGVLMP